MIVLICSGLSRVIIIVMNLIIVVMLICLSLLAGFGSQCNLSLLLFISRLLRVDSHYVLHVFIFIFNFLILIFNLFVFICNYLIFLHIFLTFIIIKEPQSLYYVKYKKTYYSAIIQFIINISFYYFKILLLLIFLLIFTYHFIFQYLFLIIILIDLLYFNQIFIINLNILLICF